MNYVAHVATIAKPEDVSPSPGLLTTPHLLKRYVMAAANPTRPKLTQARLKELLHYDPETGVFTWIGKANPRSNRVPIGSKAGSLGTHGYLEASVDGTRCLLHRVAWLYVYGIWPADLIDHKDCNRTNNRIGNLRPASQSGNQQNRRGAKRTSKNGLMGITFDKSRSLWTAQIACDGAHIYLGRFATKEQAHAAYLNAKRDLHPFQTLVP